MAIYDVTLMQLGSEREAVVQCGILPSSAVEALDENEFPVIWREGENLRLGTVLAQESLWFQIRDKYLFAYVEKKAIKKKPSENIPDELPSELHWQSEKHFAGIGLVLVCMGILKKIEQVAENSEE